jgi:hypothetical protein
VQETTIGGSTFGTGAAGNNTWTIITGNTFAYSGTADFSLTAAACVLTYNGTSGRTFLFLLNVAFDPTAGGAAPFSLAGVLSVNGEFNAVSPAATSAAVAKGAMFGNIPADGTSSMLTSMRRVTLNNGDTIQPVAAIFAGVSQDLKVNALSLTVVPQ